jgi:hypothetical protein
LTALRAEYEFDAIRAGLPAACETLAASWVFRKFSRQDFDCGVTPKLRELRTLRPCRVAEQLADLVMA